MDRSQREGYKELNSDSPYIIVVENWQYEPEIAFAFALLLAPLGIKYTLLPVNEVNAPVWLYYGRDRQHCQASFYIIESDFFHLYGHNGLPAKEWLCNVDRVMQTTLASHVLEADIIAAAFFVASGYEETVNSERDLSGRFQACSSLRWPEMISRPLVDEWSRSLVKFFGTDQKIPASKFSWGIALTHDIDSLKKGTLEALYDSIVRHPDRNTLTKIRAILTDYFRHGDLYDNLQDLVNKENAQGVKSSFYMLKKTGYSDDANYRWDNPAVLKWMKNIIDREWEIGLHGSYFSLTQKSLLSREKSELEQILGFPIHGGRQHFLRFNLQDSWQKQIDAGLYYDTTLGYADAPGFRNGLARPFQPFDFQARQKYPIWEIPLIVMDATLYQYLGLSADQAWKQIVKILNSVRQVNGLAAVLWHNTYFTPYKYPGYAQLFWKMIDWCRQAGGECGPAVKLLNDYFASESK